MLKVLMEPPDAAMTATVPKRTMGTARVGISVARQFCRKRNMMAATSTMASMRVCTILLMEARMKGTLSRVM